jgi:large subunit ribosomal protein L24
MPKNNIHVKKGDNIIVITGKDKGKSGVVEMSFPKKNMILVPGVNMLKKHQKARSEGGKGQIIEKAMPIDASNVKLAGAPAKKVKAVKASKK